MIPQMSVSVLYIRIVFLITSLKVGSFFNGKNYQKPNRVFAEDTLPLNVRTYE
jgi:hypothetical protein